MDFNQYQKRILGFMNPTVLESDDATLINATLGLAGEAGEVTDIVKKFFYHGHDLDRQALIKELGDLQFYVALCAYAVDVPLEDVALLNVEKLTKRYPSGFTVEDSKAQKDKEVV